LCTCFIVWYYWSDCISSVFSENELVCLAFKNMLIFERFDFFSTSWVLRSWGVLVLGLYDVIVLNVEQIVISCLLFLDLCVCHRIHKASTLNNRTIFFFFC
jgi:hypothetical protein